MAESMTAFAEREAFTPSSVTGKDELSLLFRLGYGGMAEVFLAANARGDLSVVKRMYAHSLEDPAAEQMFLDEARLALCLRHPHIVESRRLGTFAGRHGIVMEFLQGQTLQKVLKCSAEAGEPLPLEVAVRIAIEALSGLDYAHELVDHEGQPLAAVHRDVSPHNIFITYDGRTKLLDFGIAKTSMQEARTRTGLLKGKIAYMAPEQACGEVLDRRADVWSIGAVLWEMVTGTRLFKAMNEAAALNLTLTAPIPLPRTRRFDVPADLERIVMTALQRDRCVRYASARAMQSDLETWLDAWPSRPKASALPALMKLMFSEEIAAIQVKIRLALEAAPDLVPDSGIGPHTRTSTSVVFPEAAPSSSVAPIPSPVSSVTDLVAELSKQRRATAQLFLGLGVGLLGAFFALGYLFYVRTNASAAADPTPSAAVAAAPPLESAGKSSPAASTNPISVPISAPLPVPENEPRPRSKAGRSSSASGAARRAQAERAERPVVEPSAPAESGFLTIDTTPWSTVSTGGKVLGQTPLVGVKLPAGRHTLVLENPELGLRTSYQVTINAGQTTARRIGLDQ
jgi:serine/threonine protein kinase